METALVTGANSGIGRATALALASGGYRVFAAMRDLGKGEKLLGMAAQAGCEVEPLALDVADDRSVAEAFEKVHSECPALDVLINNAGVGLNATTEDIDIDEAKAVFDVNYFGAVRCVQAALPKMRERRSGHIVNVSSVAGRVAAIGQTVYASSKWALECLSENLVQEVAPFGLRVTVIEPGVTRTAILPKNVGHPVPTFYEAHYRRMLQFYAKGIQANVSPDEVAATVLAALRDPQPRFRYTCAYGGEGLTRGRQQISDQDWIELGRRESDDEYYACFERLFGLDLRPS